LGILTNIVAAEEDEIAAIGESLRPVDEWSGIERRGIDTAKIATLHCLLTGDEFGSAEALRLNFVQKVVAAGTELDTALQLAHAIAAQAPLAVVATRLNALKAVEHGPVVAMQEFITTQQRLSRSEDAAEGVRSFVERRAARFQGR